MLQKHPEKWAFGHDVCKACKTTEYNHHSNGVCRKCIAKWRYENKPAYKASIKKANKKYLNKIAKCEKTK